MTPADDRSVTVTLRNGVVATLRPLQPDDRERIAAAVRALDRESIYLRLFSFRNELTEAGLDRIMSADHEREEVVIATTRKNGDEIVIGSSRYVVTSGPPGAQVAEVAFMVEEDYQGLGLASRLLSRLAEIARSRGIVAFEAEVLPVNKAMLGVFARCGLPMSKRNADGAVHLRLELTPPPG